MILRSGHHDGVYIDAGEPDQTGIQSAVFHQLLHLDNDLTAGVLGGLSDGQGLGGDTLALEGAVAVGVGISGADHAHIDGERLVKQPGLTIDGDALHQRSGLPGLLVEHAALQLRVHEGLQAHMGDEAGLAGGNITEELRNNALRIVISSKLVFQRQLLKPGDQAPVTTDDPADQALLAQVVEAALVGVALTGGIDGGKFLGRAGAQIELLDGLVNLLRHHSAYKAAKGDGSAIVNIGADCLLC